LVNDHTANKVCDIESDNQTRCMQVCYSVNLPITAVERATIGVDSKCDCNSDVLKQMGCIVDQVWMASPQSWYE